MKTVSKVLSVTTLSVVLALSAGCASTATQESTGQFIDSSIVTAGVKTALAQDDLTTLLDVEVETFRDVVQLSGFVDTEEQKMQAGEVASTVDGVREVENNLVVKPAS
ncbi:MAG: BON domain-containing protein [Granulosicoccus sp.]|nr:BON domain-containing protein [Granulosicoccus sp.]